MSYNFRPLILRDPTAITPELKQEIDAFNKKWSRIHALAEDKELYHYTDINGLEGILESKQLWFSHMNTLNDPLEVEYGQKKIISEINKRLVDEENKDIRTFYDSMKPTIKGFGKTLHHGFVCCFCEDGNLLSQWREYSDKGGGYCVGFNFDSNTRASLEKDDIENFINDDEKLPQPLLRKVIYDVEDQEKLINDYLDQVIKGYNKGIVGKIKGHFSTSNHHAAVMGGQAIDPLLDMVLSFKHPAFEVEKEWRLINIVRKNYDPEFFKFRKQNESLIPYRALYVFNIDDNEALLPINSISVGPSLDQESSKSAITLLTHHISSKSELINVNATYIQINEAGYSLR